MATNGSNAHNTSAEIGDIVIGMDEDAALDLVVKYIKRTQKFKTDEMVFVFWRNLNDDEKIDLVTKALS